MTIGMLPDVVLLEMFDSYKGGVDYDSSGWNWDILVHVCRRWRQVVFESPLRLDLKTLCKSRTPVQNNLDIWPTLPIVINYVHHEITTDDEDNVIAALEHPNRVCNVALSGMVSELGKITTAMQEPFPVLMSLLIHTWDLKAPVLHAKFLGGSAPCLRKIYLDGIPFPALPTLFLSTGDLVTLTLHNIPPAGYIPPEAMVVGLAALPRLEVFDFGFQLASSRPDRIPPLPVTRAVLPALTRFDFNGASEYQEALVARIDAHQLDRVEIHYLNQLVDFQVPHLCKFIDRSVGPKLTQSGHAEITFDSTWVSFERRRHANDRSVNPCRIVILCPGIDWQVWHIAQVLSHISTTLSRVVHLRLKVHFSGRPLNGTDEIEWLDLLRQFSPVKTLCVDWGLAGYIAHALEGISEEMIAEVLPSLDLIFLAGQRASSIERFITARQLSGFSVTVVDTITDFDERLESYITE